MSDKGNGPRPSTGTGQPVTNQSNTNEHKLLKMGKSTDFKAGGPKTPA